MKQLTFLVSLILLITSVSCKKQKLTYKDAKIYGLASPIQLKGDTTRVKLSDYFPNPVIIDSTTTDDDINASWVDDFLFLVRTNESLKPLSNLTIFAEGIPYSILLKAPKGESAIISIEDKGYEKVLVKGEFNDWNINANPLVKKGNAWSVKLFADPGTYAYKLVADGKEINHTGVAEKDNGMGGTNNLLEIKGVENEVEPLLKTLSHNKTEITLLAKNTQTVYAYWNNFRLQTKADADTLKVLIPPFAKYEARSHIRVFAHSKNLISNDILVPLKKGKVITDPSDLTNNDWHSSTMYFMMIDRFMDGDSSNNKKVEDPSILDKAQYQGGDITGITQKIRSGYFQDLGINTIWVSPITQNPEGAWGQFSDPNTKFSGYHGYWPITSTTVDYRLGNPESVRNMLNEAHKNGIAVVLDYVANHVHQEHSVYQKHKDWVTPLYLTDGRMNTELWDEQRLTTWFDTFLPTLNLMDQKVTEYMVDSAIFWVEEYDFDGIRHDATKHIPLNFWRTLTQRIKEVAIKKGKHIYQIGETYGSHGLINSYIGSGMIDAQFDFNMYDNALPVFAKDDEDFKRLVQSLETSLETYGYHHLMGNITGNQDKPRFASYADGGIIFDTPWQEYKRIGWKQNISITDTLAYSKMAMFNAFNMTIPGIPIIYYGDEIAMAGAGDPDNRRMMKFEGLDRHQAKLKADITQLINLRNSNMALTYGDTEILYSKPNVLVLRRSYFDNEVIVMINKGPTETRVAQKNKDGLVFNLKSDGRSYTIQINGEIIN